MSHEPKHYKFATLLMIAVAIAAITIFVTLYVTKGKQIKKLNNEIINTSTNSGNLMARLDNLQGQNSDIKDKYDQLKNAVLHDPAHADMIGAILMTCDPSYKNYIKPPGNLTPDQQKTVCYQSAQNTFIDDYVHSNQ